MIYSNEFSFGLDFSAAITMPLMGFWNAVIYTTASWTTVKWLFVSGLVRPDSSCCREVIGRGTNGRLELPSFKDREDYPLRVIRVSLAERLQAMAVVSTKGDGCGV